ncbi:hypothetical protein ACU4GD_45145 [Cupriavidus basilensis]
MCLVALAQDGQQHGRKKVNATASTAPVPASPECKANQNSREDTSASTMLAVLLFDKPSAIEVKKRRVQEYVHNPIEKREYIQIFILKSAPASTESGDKKTGRYFS